MKRSHGAEFKGILMAMRLYPKPWPLYYAPYGIGVPILILMACGIALPVEDIALTLGLVFFLMSLTFVLNYISDAEGDSQKPDKGLNPIATGKLSPYQLKVMAYALFSFIIILLGISFWVSGSLMYIIFGLIGIMFGTTYSMGPRLKESICGPLIAALFVLGPMFMLIVRVHELWGGIPRPALIYATFLLAFGLYMEVDHTLYDYMSDAKASVLTFAVRIGPYRAGIWRDGFATMAIGLGLYITYIFSIHATLLLIISLVLYGANKFDFRLIMAPLAIYMVLALPTWPQVVAGALLSMGIILLFLYFLFSALRHYTTLLRDIAMVGTGKARSRTTAALRDMMYEEFYRR